MKRREELKPKKKKRVDSDAIVVLGVLGGIILIAVIMAIFQSGDAGNTLSSELSGNGQDKDMSDSIKIVLTCAFFSAFFVCLFIIKAIRDKKRKKRQEELENLKSYRSWKKQGSVSDGRRWTNLCSMEMLNWRNVSGKKLCFEELQDVPDRILIEEIIENVVNTAAGI